MSTAKDAYYGDPHQRPPRPKFNGDSIPPSLRVSPRWVTWRFIWKEKEHRWTKLPLNPHTDCRKAAKSYEPASWSDFETARDAANRAHRYDPAKVDGIGYVFHGDGDFGLDIDGCRKPETGELSELAAGIVKAFGTYAEVSPSGMGIKLFGRGTLPWKTGRKMKLPDGQELELYDHGRFFTVTGLAIRDSAAEVSDCSAVLVDLIAKYFPAAEAGKKSSNGNPASKPSEELDDQRVIDFICRKRHALWNGDTSGHGGDDSAADLALCNIIAFYVGPDPNRIDSIFRMSRLMRDKWERVDYRGMTIGKALEGRTDYYTPSRGERQQQEGGNQDSHQVADPLSDVRNARTFCQHHRDTLRYVDGWNSWLTWDSHRWQLDRERRVELLAKRSVNRILAEASAEVCRARASGDKVAIAVAEAREQHSKRSHSAKAIAAMIGLARSEPGIATLPEVFDQDPWLFNTMTGTLDLRTDELKPHKRDDFLTKLCPTAYNPTAICPTWERFLMLVFQQDEELIEYIRRWFGYCLTGLTTEHVLLVPWGIGANGKSTLLETVMDTMGSDYAMKAPLSMLMSRGSEAHPTERADLQGKRLVCAVETEDGKRLSESLVKELTGGDKIRARRMRENFFEFPPTHKLMQGTNYKPVIRGTDNGIWRRLRLVPFLAKFWNPDEEPAAGEVRNPEYRADKGMREKLLAEREGILAWMVRGCREWRQQGLGLPKSVADATKEYREEENIVGRFLEERCVVHRSSDNDFAVLRVRAGELYVAFKTWCVQSGICEHDAPTQRSFGLALTAAGFEKYTSNGTWYPGLSVKHEPANDPRRGRDAAVLD